MAAAVLKKGPKAVLVNVKDSCSQLWSVSVFLTISALPRPRCISSAFPHGKRFSPFHHRLSCFAF